MPAALRRLALGLSLIAAAGALLLVSDLGSRRTDKPAGEKRVARIAILQHASQAILDQGREGMLAGLTERGWVEGKNLEVRRFNAEGDMPVSQAIAREITNGGYDLILTITTPSLQAVANANRTTQIPHVFALVADPVAAGVGITAPLEHPPWLAGFGTMQPVAKAFQVAREMNPGLKKVGIAWNAAEANSEAQVKLARKVCADLGIELVEVTVENSAGVAEATGALTARGVEAIWVNGDISVITAIDSVVAAATRTGIPVFTVIPPNAKRGALFDLGADYFEVGRLAGDLAGEILNGRNPAGVPIENVMPEIQTLNLQALGKLRAGWTAPESLRSRAQLVIDESGAERARSAPAATRKTPHRLWKIAVVLYNETPPAEETLDGMNDGWAASPLREGKDYTIKLRSAQGDMGALSGIVDAALTEGADLVVPLSTPALQAAIRKIKDRPVVFSLVANPIAAGAGTSYENHLPNVTGVAVLGPFAETLDVLERYFPSYKRLGTLYCPAEVNSVDLRDALADECQRRGFVLESVAANSPAEFADAALALVSRPIDAIVQVSDNLSNAGFGALARAARQARKPLFSLNSTTIPQGAAVAFGRDYHAAGEATVRLIERVMAGEDPARMPFILPPKIVRAVSIPNARAVGMTIPPGLIKEADRVVE